MEAEVKRVRRHRSLWLRARVRACVRVRPVGSPEAPSGRRTSAGTGSSHRSCPPGRGRRRCAAAAYWPGRTLWAHTDARADTHAHTHARTHTHTGTNTGTEEEKCEMFYAFSLVTNRFSLVGLPVGRGRCSCSVELASSPRASFLRSARRVDHTHICVGLNYQRRVCVKQH